MSDLKFSVQELLNNQPTRWDQLIAGDLSAEIRALLAEKVHTIPEMRRFLAIKGYRDLHQSLKAAADGRTGEEALRAVASRCGHTPMIAPACRRRRAEIRL